MNYSIITQKEIRNQFWSRNSYLKHGAWKQNQYSTDVRVAFCSFVEYLHRNGEISDALAQRATL
jgi:hypothetical protein